ncbi:MAG: YqgE/AlgH family protein [Dehalococcoidia bacterium]
MTQPLTGKILIASPLLKDPNFDRTVVFICAHSDGGSFGLVLNRPLEMEVADHLPQWLDVVSSPTALFRGGPVEPASAYGLARTRDRAPDEGWMAITGTLGLVDLSQDTSALAPELIDLRIFTGYAGWSPGQLDEELQAEAWFVIEPGPGDLFTRAPGDLWREVLRRQPGKLAMFAYFPEDASQN